MELVMTRKFYVNINLLDKGIKEYFSNSDNCHCDFMDGVMAVIKEFLEFYCDCYDDCDNYHLIVEAIIDELDDRLKIYCDMNDRLYEDLRD